MDLLLSSNYQDIQVLHWVLDLACHFEQRQFNGTALFLCTSKAFHNSQKQSQHDFTSNTMPNSSSTSVAANFHNSKDTAVYSSHQDFVLDCHALDIDSCYFYDLQKDSDIDVTTYSNIYTYKTNLQIPSNEMKKYYDIAEKLSKNAKGNQLDFKVEESCLRIFIPHKDFYQQRVFAVKIGYKTKKEGSSLTWTEDQNLRPCVFTSGHLLNNRSLMPCQDMPQAMSSWHCLITVPPIGEQLTVLMAGEGEPAVDVREDGSQVFKYQSSYPMPASTFALAIGNWPLYCSFPHQIDNCFKQSTSCLGPRFQIFAPLNLHGQKLRRLKEYLQDCFHGLQSILGAYPLQRLDILVVPEGFDSLGMMCPHLMFLSQSVLLCEDTQAAFNMFYRVAHELCHTWLGVLTGPSDWTEEWLTEGICCYLEDVVHAKTLKWNEHETRERLEIRKLLKYRVLKAEINTTREDLQTLRPNGDTSCASLSSMNAEPCIVKNGLNPEKTLLQVHYLKGFFLLKHLEELSGRDEFLGTLRRFIDANLGQLFSSKDLLEHCFRELPKLRQSNLTVDIVCQEWLDTPGMPQPLTAFEVNEENSLYKDVQCELAALKAQACRKRGKTSPKCLEHDAAVKVTPPGGKGACPSPLNSKDFQLEQSVLLLDYLIGDNVQLTMSQMKWLRDRLKVLDTGAEVQHSWCELVIQRRDLRWLKDVETFLKQHQAMGVYLYGELMISENRRLQALAHRVFNTVRPSMAEAQRLAVEEMLFPT